MARIGAGLLCWGLACGDGGRDENIDLADSEGAGNATEDPMGADSTGDGEDGPKLDIGTGLDLGTGDLNCSAVDFLFVIDNSSSMEREQQRLVEAVPGFTDTILTALPGISDVRVGVVDTDSYPGLGTDNPLEGCPDGADCNSCDYTLGALLSKPNSALDPSQDCGFADGLPYMDARSDQFADEFACAARVGLEGNQIEQQAGALVASLSPELLEGGCNDGFLRNDALLIVLVITDEEDNYMAPPSPQGGSNGEPSDWAAAVVTAKGGIASNAVVLGLVGGSPLYSSCPPLNSEGQGAEPTDRLVEFVETFDNHFLGSVCEDDYQGFFEEALIQVAQGCAQFQPG